MSSKSEKKFQYYFWTKIDGLKTRIAMDSQVKAWMFACALSVIAEEHIMKWTLSRFKVKESDDYYLLNSKNTYDAIKSFLKMNKSKDSRRKFKSSYSVKDRKKYMDIIINYEKYPLLYLTDKDIYELSAIYFLLHGKSILSKIFGIGTFNIIKRFVNFKVTQKQLDYCSKCTCTTPFEEICEEILNHSCNCTKCSIKSKSYDRITINKETVYFCGIIDSMYSNIKSLNYDFLVRIMDSVKPKYYRHHVIDYETNEIWASNEKVPYYNDQNQDDSMYFEIKRFNPFTK